MVIGWLPDMDETPLALVGGRLWLPEGLRRGDIIIKEGRISALGEVKIPFGARVVEVPDLLIAPGLIDADHPLADDCLPPLLPGPYGDRAGREAEFERAQPATWVAAQKLAAGKRARAGALACLRNGVTVAVSTSAEKPAVLRATKTAFIESLDLERNPEKIFKKAGKHAVAVRLADGSNWNATREFAKLEAAGGVGPHTLAVGCAGLSVEQAGRLAEAGAHLVWRPAVDRFVLGHSWPVELIKAAGDRLLLGAGSRRDGGEGLLQTLQLAEKIGKLAPNALIDAVTNRAARALKIAAGALEVGKWGDFSLWRAETMEEALFRQGKAALQMTIVGGQVMLTRKEWRDALPNRKQMKPVADEDNLLSVIAPPECFT
ncbi:MAG TPA: amidohydrolase family protein [bacterium]|nr:amidohydrolase family protein [bacterium]